jgi:hypothetical protein
MPSDCPHNGVRMLRFSMERRSLGEILPYDKNYEYHEN